MKFSSSHEWISITHDNSILSMGITDYAQDELGEIVFVELPKPGTALKKGEVFVVVESVKTASDITTPIAGKIVAVNTTLETAPGTINTAAEDKGWIVQIAPDAPVNWEQFMSKAEYDRYVGVGE